MSPPDSTKMTCRSGCRVLEFLDGGGVHGGVFADGGVRAAAGFDADDPVLGQDAVGGQDLGVLDGVDVVGDGGHGDLAAHVPGEPLHELGLAGADRSADADFDGFSHAVLLLAHEHPGTLALVPHLRNFQSGADGPEVVRRQVRDPLDGGSDVVGRFPQQPLAGVLAQRDGADGVLRQRGDGGEKVRGERFGAAARPGNGRRRRTPAAGARRRGRWSPAPGTAASSGEGKTSVADLQQPRRPS